MGNNNTHPSNNLISLKYQDLFIATLVYIENPIQSNYFLISKYMLNNYFNLVNLNSLVIIPHVQNHSKN